MASPNFQIDPDTRAAISEFLNRCQKEARPLATSEAMEAIRRIFPGLEISDADLMDALTSEASAAGFEVVITLAEIAVRRKALERWDNEGGAIGQTQREIDNDTSGTRRRAEEVKQRGRLI